MLDLQTGGSIVAVISVVYGLGIAFVLPRLGLAPRARNTVVVVGALIILVAAIALVGVPLITNGAA